jgi:hypothetical protein
MHAFTLILELVVSKLLLKLTLSFAVQNIIEKPRDGFKIIQSNL